MVGAEFNDRGNWRGYHTGHWTGDGKTKSPERGL
jgi:hypothetical protein